MTLKQWVMGFVFTLVVVPTLAHAATIAELQVQLRALQAQLATLQVQQRTTVTTSCPNLIRNLSRGSRGADVTQLQQLLIAQNLLTPDSATGFFGALTEAAVKQWQSKNGIASSGTPATTGYGTLGPRTRAAIVRVCGGSSATAPSVQTSSGMTNTGTNQGGTTNSVNFFASPTSGTAPLRVVFRANVEWSSSYFIDFGDGQSSPLQNNCPGGLIGACGQPTAEHTYSNPSTYIAQLIKSDSGGCGVITDPRCLGAPGSRSVLGTVVITVSAPGGGTPPPPPPPQSCSFAGSTVTHGSSVTAYQSATVAYSQTCTSQTRTCSNGSLSGSYAYTTCAVSNPVIQTNQRQLLTGDLSGTSPFGPSIVMPNFYSPELLPFGGGVRMYFGGWYEVGARDGHDDIYVADCTSNGSSCSNVRMILDGANQGPPAMNLNDPTIVTITAGPNPYLVMYLTCTYHGEGAGSDKVCYTTSWANDGIVWGKPGTLVAGYALPSVVMKDSKVLLYAMKTGENAYYRFDLGTSGTNVGVPVKLQFTNMPAALGSNAYYVNIHVRYDATQNKYFMLAQGPNTNVSWPWPAAIDLLESVDGITWSLVHHAMMKPLAGQFELNAPAFLPSSINTIFFGSTAATNSTGYTIYSGEWSVQ